MRSCVSLACVRPLITHRLPTRHRRALPQLSCYKYFVEYVVVKDTVASCNSVVGALNTLLGTCGHTWAASSGFKCVQRGVYDDTTEAVVSIPFIEATNSSNVYPQSLNTLLHEYSQFPGKSGTFSTSLSVSRMSFCIIVSFAKDEIRGKPS